MKQPKQNPLVETLPASVPFVGPEAIERARGTTFSARLGANESVFGPAPSVLEAIKAATAEAWMYGDPESFELRAALAEHLEIAPNEVVVGEGIDALLGYVVRIFIGQGDAVVTSDGAYPTFNYHVAGFGGNLISIPYRDDKEDIDGLLAAAQTANAKMIYLSNPDNPMGSWHSAETISAMIEGLPEGCLLLLDEAYVEFAAADAVLPIDTSDPRVIRMRTFSKAHGMAGMRVGYAFGHVELVKAFEKIRNHFGMNRISQAAALAALKDNDWVAHVLGEVERARARISEIAQAHGLTPLASATNFVTLDCGSDGAFARAVLEALVARDVFVRMPFAVPGNRCIRVSAGKDEDLDRFEAVLGDALQDARNA
ncbi:MAG: pyridoxal phosphate-dependent aminotransferase [Paracoccaceae bacterium]